jgi:hypothetical protein
LLAAFIVSASCASPPPPPPEPETGVVRLPIALEQGMAWVNASVQGRPLRLLVDLGGFDTVALVPEELKELPVSWTGRERATFSAMGESATAREYELKDFELGGVRFTELRGFEDLLHKKPRAKGRSGYVGLGLLRRFRLVIDYPARQLVLIWPDAATPAEYDVASWPTLKFEKGDDGVMTRARVDGAERILVWDTGVSHCVLKKGLHGQAPVRKTGGQLFITASSFDVAGIDAGPMDFALLDFKEPKADGFIGFPSFARHAVYVDFRNRLLAVRP